MKRNRKIVSEPGEARKATAYAVPLVASLMAITGACTGTAGSLPPVEPSAPRSRPAPPPASPGPSGQERIYPELFWIGDAPVALTRPAARAVARQLVLTADGAPSKAALHLRLAEHHRVLALRLRLRCDELRRAAAQMALEDATDLEDCIDDRSRHVEESIKHYSRIVTGPAFKTFEPGDEVLFKLAHMLLKASKMEGARQVFSQLIRRFPASKYLTYTYISFGEFYRENAQASDARMLYQHARRFPDSSIYWYAVYMAGWCSMKDKKHREALETFARVLKGHGTRSLPRKVRTRLVRAARRATVQAYSETGRPEKAGAFFGHLAPQHARRMLKQLKKIYLHRSRPDAARVIEDQLSR